MKIDIVAVGTFCNSWPNLVVEGNNETLFDGEIQNTKSITLEFTKTVKKGNNIIIGMNNKSFGKDNIWDTKTENNVIKGDKTIKILSLKLDGVECKELFNNKFNVKRTDRQPSYFPDVVDSVDVMNYNGYFGFGFDLPLYNSIIKMKFKRDHSDEVSYFSNYTKVFHYDGEEKIIQEIKGNLREIDEKFSDKRSKIRNS